MNITKLICQQFRHDFITMNENLPLLNIHTIITVHTIINYSMTIVLLDKYYHSRIAQIVKENIQ